MILLMAREGGVISRIGVHLLEYSGDRSLRSSPTDQCTKDSLDIDSKNRHHSILSWQPGVDEAFPSSRESIATKDLVYPSTDVSLPTFQKLRGLTHLADMTPFSEDEDVLDMAQDCSPVSHGRRRKHAGYSVAHLNLPTNTNDATPDETSTHSEEHSLHRVKLLCSYGGRILPRPTDNQLRYVGGDTRLITVSRDIHCHELLQKMAELYALAHSIKYKLPEEDLDALVSVSSDEDVANMMEEYDRLQSSEASPRLRLFLFTDMDQESVQNSEPLGDQRSCEQRYVDAVNGLSATAYRKHSGDEGSLAIAPVVTESLVDVGDTWGFNRQQETVPVAMLAPQISQDVAPLIQSVPVALPVSSISLMSAPSSAPSSPPLLSRVLKQGLLPDMRLPDHHSHTYGHQCNNIQADELVPEEDNCGVNLAISSNVYEHLHVISDLRRGLESSEKLQHECDRLGGQQELGSRDDLRRLPEVRMARVPSHGKLTRLSEHPEATPSPRQRQSYQQLEQFQHQGCWPPHLLEEQTHIYSRRVELMQPTGDAVVQPVSPRQQPELPTRGSLQSVISTATTDQPMYRPVDHHSVGDEVFAPFMQRSVSANTMGSLGFMAVSSYHVGAGSAPSSPKTNCRDMLNMHSTGQFPSLSQQALRTYAAPIYVEQQHRHGLRQHPHSDGTIRSRPVTSPPRYRDHLGQTDNRLIRPTQQPVIVNADIVQQELFLYDGHNSPHRQRTEGIVKGQVPQYLGLNPFQDGQTESSCSDLQDADYSRGRRERIAQQSLRPSHVDGQGDSQIQSISTADQLQAHSRYQDKITEWGIHLPSYELEEIGSWHGGKGQTNEGAGLELETGGGSFLNSPESSDCSIPMSDPYLLTNVGVDEVHTANNQQPSSIPTQSDVLFLHPSPLGQVVVDIPQVSPFIVRESESGFSKEPAAKPLECMPDLESVNALAEVSLVTSESPSDNSVMDMVGKAATGTSDKLVHHLSNTRSGNTESVGTTELRWVGLNDIDQSRIDPLTLVSSNNPDRFQQLCSSGIPEGRQVRPRSETRIEAPGEVALQEMHAELATNLDNGTLEKEKASSSAYGVHYPIVIDVMCPPRAPILVSTGTQLVTTGATPFSIPALSYKTSTESSLFIMPSASYRSTSFGLQKALSVTPKVSEASICGSSGQNGEIRKDNKMLTSQLSATGHLAEDMASSVLFSSKKDMLAPLPPEKSEGEGLDHKWLCLSQGSTSVVAPNLAHAPTFSASNWNSLQNLTNVHAEVDVDRSGIPDSSAENGGLDVQPPLTTVEEPTALSSIVELVTEAAVPNHENLKRGSSNPGTAEDAEADAIKSGLQTILNADLEEMRELGSGTFGTVYHGKWRGTDVAIKRIKASCFAGRPAERDRLIADFWREACTLSQLHHPNVVAFYGVVRDGPGGTLATVTEYMVNGSLKQVLQKKDRTIDRRKRLLIAMDAAFGMEYLHSKNIVHFDLKCDNLLVNMRDPHRPICKVGDLGLSKVKHQTMVSGGVRGTLPWMAPELLNGSSTLVTEKVDAFSFGIVMWELLTGEEPYANMHYGAIIGGIVNNTLRPSIPTWCDPLWKSLMERCWSAEPASRPSFSEVASELRVMATAQPKAHVAL